MDSAELLSLGFAQMSLCQTCRNIDIEEYLFNEKYPGTLELGYLQDIFAKDNCPLCKLVIQALNMYSNESWKAGVYPVEKCYFGRRIERASAPVIEVWLGRTMTVGRILPIKTSGNRLDSGPKIPLSRNAFGKRVDYSIIRSWIDDCSHSHDNVCERKKSTAMRIEITSPLRLRLVDTKQQSLITTSTASNIRYIAITYVWGQVPSFKTLKNNLHDLERDGALHRIRDRLPRVINDAIDVVENLGERYLWVDALCVVQDDNSTEAENISRMHEIYDNSWLTIVALAGEDANYGLPGVGRKRLIPEQPPTVLAGLYFLPELTRLSDEVKSSRWTTRAWTLQESAFSCRFLYFSNAQVFWQCNTVQCSESNSIEYPIDPEAVKYIPHGVPISQLTFPDWIDTDEPLAVYWDLVAQYSCRELTYHSDSLSAFAGILSALCSRFSWVLVSALPERDFDMVLLWRPKSTAQLRPRRVNLADNTGAASSGCWTPTWCWTAWEGDITWDRGRLKGPLYNRVTIEPEVEDYWIKDHTGYRLIIRDLYRDLEKEKSHPDPSTIDSISYTNNNTTEVEPPPVLLSAVSGDSFPESLLLFEAKTTSFDNFTMVAPHPRSRPHPENTEHSDPLESTYSPIYHRAGRHCGAFMEADVKTIVAMAQEGSQLDIVLLSRSRQRKWEMMGSRDDRFKNSSDFREPYYEEIFDTEHYRHQPGWALNIMLIRWTGKSAERVAIGQIHVDAWDETCAVSKPIVLT